MWYPDVVSQVWLEVGHHIPWSASPASGRPLVQLLPGSSFLPTVPQVKLPVAIPAEWLCRYCHQSLLIPGVGLSICPGCT